MIELAIRPLHGVMAGFASRGESGRRVVHGADGVGVVLLMAGDAERARQIVIVVDVAVRALSRRDSVGTSKRETRAVVVEGSVEPGRSAVARVTGLREIACNVIRIGRALKVLQVATDARGGVQAVVVIDMAVGAQSRRHGMHASQREAGGGVIELAICPGNGVVAIGACGREARVRYRRDCLRVVILVATDAGRVGDVVVVVDMAVGALPGRNRV